MELTLLLVIIIGIVGLVGWVLNIVKLVGTLNSPITGMFIVRIIGVFIPVIGAVVGWL